MRESCRTLILGAGITGLTIARELVSRGHSDILILEKEPHLGAHASGRNSGVLHAGIYYVADSLKARFCLEGNRLMKAFCRENGLTLKETAKVIAARLPEEVGGLRNSNAGLTPAAPTPTASPAFTSSMAFARHVVSLLERGSER